jgi:ubiquinone/menaquinone biosynthesis C-methylase UbiE
MADYDQIALGYNELHKDEQQNKLDIIKQYLKADKNSKLLDVGCGTGLSSDFNCYVVGIDPSIELLKQNKNLRKLQGEAEHLPFKDNSFDYVITLTALHNFNDIKKGLEEIRRVGKYFVLTILNKSRKFGIIENLIKKNFDILNVFKEEKDTIFTCKKP